MSTGNAASAASTLSKATEGWRKATQMLGSYKAAIKVAAEASEELSMMTGMTGAKLNELTESFRAVAAKVPNNLAEVRDVIGKLSNDTKLAGVQLESFGQSVLTGSRLAGVDGAGMLNTASSTMKDWGLSAVQGIGLMDTLFVAHKRSGMSVMDLNSRLKEQGVAFRALGLDLNQTLALFMGRNNFAGDSIKAVDTMQAAFQHLADTKVEHPGKALQELVEKIKSAQSESVKLGIASRYLGEELGKKLVDVMETGAAAVNQNLLAELQSSSGAMEQHEKKTQSFLQKMKGAFSANAFRLSVNAAAMAWPVFLDYGKKAGEAILTAGDKANAAFKTIKVATGANRAEMDVLMKSYSTLGTKVPDDLSKVAEVVADIKSKMNGDDGQIQSFGKAVLDVSRLIGGDSSKLMGSAIDILKTWGGTASDGAGLMDKLLIASQRSTVGFADLGAQINEQGAVLRGMGFNFDESLSMLAQWGKEGKSAKDTVDMMNKAFTALSKQEGVTDPVQSFKDMITLIQNAKTEQGALNLAMAGFGEAGKGMAEAIRSSTFVPDPNILGAIQTSTGAVVQQTQETMTLGERWGIVGNQILIALAPLGQALLYLAETVVPFVGGAVGFLARNADILAPALAGVAAVILWALAPSLWALVPSLLASAAGAWAIVAPFLPIIGLALLVGAAIGGLAYLFREHFGKIRNTVMGVVSAVQEFFGLVDSKKDLSLNTSLNHDTAMPAGFPKELMAAPSSVLPPLPNPTAAQPLFSAPAMQMPGPLVKPADVKPDPVLPSGVAAKLGSAASPSAAVLNAIPAGAGSQTGAYANQVYQGAAAASAGKKPAAGTGDIQITVTGNEFHVRKESDIDEIARALAKQIRAAGGLMA